MRAVCDEADEHGWVLCLEGPGTMAAYYADFEVHPLAPAQASLYTMGGRGTTSPSSAVGPDRPRGGSRSGRAVAQPDQGSEPPWQPWRLSTLKDESHEERNWEFANPSQRRHSPETKERGVRMVLALAAGTPV
jgi:hypothetical protein